MLGAGLSAQSVAPSCDPPAFGRHAPRRRGYFARHPTYIVSEFERFRNPKDIVPKRNPTLNYEGRFRVFHAFNAIGDKAIDDKIDDKRGHLIDTSLKVGASLKDIGRKSFAFTQLNTQKIPGLKSPDLNGRTDEI